jgi:hypothetical protein
MRIFIQLFLSLCLLFSTNLAAQATDTATFELKHRTASQLQAVLEPLLEDAEKIVSHQNTLIITAVPERLHQLSKVLKSIDIPMVNLLISFSMGHDRPDIHFKEYPAEVKDFTTYDKHYHRKQIASSRSRNRNIQNIRVLNGESAQIESNYVFALMDYQAAADASGSRTGKSEGERLKEVFQPETTINAFQVVIERDESSYTRDSSGTYADRFYEKGQHYESIKDSLYVTPNLIDNKVMLEISATEGQIQPNPIEQYDSHYSQSHVLTKVLLPLDQWIYLGGNRNKNDMMAKGYRYHTQSKKDEKHHIWIKVEIVE